MQKSICLLIATLLIIHCKAQNMTDLPVSTYETQVRKFKPEQGLAAKNSNDIRGFIYEWFTHFEHASAVDYYLRHLDDGGMTISFPGVNLMTSHADFTKWYSNLLAQTLWNFHEISKIQVKRTASQEFLVSFIADWYGEVKSSSDQAAGWQNRKDSFLYHYTLRQTWSVKEINNIFIIKELQVKAGDTPSPISE